MTIRPLRFLPAVLATAGLAFAVACSGGGTTPVTPTSPATPAATTPPKTVETAVPAATPAPKTVETAVPTSAATAAPKTAPATPPAATTVPGAPATAGGALASCLVGTWEVPDLDAYFRSVFEQTGASIPGGPTFQGTTGTLRYTFLADGTGRGEADLTARLSIQGLQASVTMKGAPTARYQVTGPGTIQFSGASGEDLRLTVTLAGNPLIDATAGSLFGDTASTTTNASVTCSGNEMTIQVTDVAGTPVTPLRRVS